MILDCHCGCASLWLRFCCSALSLLTYGFRHGSSCYYNFSNISLVRKKAKIIRQLVGTFAESPKAHFSSISLQLFFFVADLNYIPSPTSGSFTRSSTRASTTPKLARSNLNLKVRGRKSKIHNAHEPTVNGLLSSAFTIPNPCLRNLEPRSKIEDVPNRVHEAATASPSPGGGASRSTTISQTARSAGENCHGHRSPCPATRLL